MATAKKTTEKAPVGLGRLETKTMEVYLKGVSPIIMNAMSAKSKQELLMPRKKTTADKAQKLKHEVLQEYNDSCYRTVGNNNPTRILFPVSGLKTALMTAALEVPGAKKTQIARLIWTEGDYIPIYGTPQILMSVVRSADINKTPDIRIRAILKEWAVKVKLTYVTPTLTSTDVTRLIEAAGLVVGLGDFRQEKGKGSYGQFRIATPDEVAGILKLGLIQQDKAFANPEYYDLETEKLFEWYRQERKERGR